MLAVVFAFNCFLVIHSLHAFFLYTTFQILIHLFCSLPIYLSLSFQLLQIINLFLRSFLCSLSTFSPALNLAIIWFSDSSPFSSLLAHSVLIPLRVSSFHYIFLMSGLYPFSRPWFLFLSSSSDSSFLSLILFITCSLNLAVILFLILCSHLASFFYSSLSHLPHYFPHPLCVISGSNALPHTVMNTEPHFFSSSVTHSCPSFYSLTLAPS